MASDSKRNLDDFKRFKVPELNAFLKERGLKSAGRTKDELVALAFAAEDMEVPIKQTAKQDRLDKAADYFKRLTTPDGKVPDPLEIKDGWIGENEGVHKWPPIMSVDITAYLLPQPNQDIGKRLLNDYKEGKGYSYFESKWMSEVWYHQIDEHSKYCFLKASITPSQRVNNIPHKAWVLAEKISGKVVAAYCSCFAG